MKVTDDVDEVELRQPDFVTVLKLIWHSVRGFFTERPGQIVGSTFLLIMLWGYHGELELLHAVWPVWHGPGIDIGNRPVILPGIPWDQELLSFWIGAFLLVVVPILIIKFGFRQRLADYGLGLPPKGRRVLAVWTFFTLVALSAPAFYLGSGDTGMQHVYPLYKYFSGTAQFIAYELSYFPFFLAIEFIFRGYLLFGLAGVREDEIKRAGGGIAGVFYFHRYALLIQMLSYTAWHLGKPTPELWGTLVWGLAAGATAYGSRSIWPVVLAHWGLNVFLDAVILGRLGIAPW